MAQTRIEITQQLYEDIYNRIAFRYFSGQSEQGLKDILRQEAGVKEIDSSLAADVRIADIYDDGMALVIAEEIIDVLYRFNATWQPTKSYDIDEVAVYEDNLYFSLTNSNVGNQPDISTSDWRFTSLRSTNEPETVVYRDATGSFAAETATLRNVDLVDISGATQARIVYNETDATIDFVFV